MWAGPGPPAVAEGERTLSLSRSLSRVPPTVGTGDGRESGERTPASSRPPPSVSSPFPSPARAAFGYRHAGMLSGRSTSIYQPNEKGWIYLTPHEEPGSGFGRRAEERDSPVCATGGGRGRRTVQPDMQGSPAGYCVQVSRCSIRQ